MASNETDSTNISDKAGVEGIADRFVGFCDILGFSNRILSDFDGTLETYKAFANIFTDVPFPDVETTIYSDAILVTGESLGRVVCAIQNIWFLASANDMMVRGAVTRGRYWVERKGNHMLVASDALARAVKLERSVGIPAVVIADDIEISDKDWFCRFKNGLLQMAILHFRDRNIVNPFNFMWYRSAADRARKLMTASPAHKDKYLWFLALHEAVENDQALVPPAVLERFMQMGVVKRRTPEATPSQD